MYRSGIKRFLALVLLGFLAVGAQAQLKNDVPSGGSVTSAKVDLLTQVGVDAKMGAQIPLDLKFRDENGRTVTLREYFKSGRPVLIAPVYFSCTMLCSQVLNGMTSALSVLKFSA